VNGSKNSNSVDGDKRRDSAEDESRPQRGGEAETTLFGMEEATTPTLPQQARDRSTMMRRPMNKAASTFVLGNCHLIRASGPALSSEKGVHR
jgi:hypothetical protein